MTVTVGLMLKAPVAGQVKTRLGREIGDAAAAQVYRRLAERQMRVIPASYGVRVYYDPPDAGAAMQEWLGDGPEYVAQASGDLGERLRAAMHRHFETRAGALVLVGGDCPYLDGECFASVETMLAGSSAALVPARDGGYCLLGLREAVEGVFLGIRWSSEYTLEDTRARLREAGVSWLETEPLEDVDDLASWKRAVARYPELGVFTGT